MAEVFKNYKSRQIGASPITVIPTVTGTTVTTVIGLSVANVSTVSCKYQVYVANSGQNYYLVKDADLIPGGAVAVVGGDQKLVLGLGDSLVVLSDTATSVDCIISVLETS